MRGMFRILLEWHIFKRSPINTQSFLLQTYANSIYPLYVFFAINIIFNKLQHNGRHVTTGIYAILHHKGNPA
jgi:hypothetical protein